MFGLAKNRFFPQYLVKVNEKYGVPTRALVLNFVVGLLFLVPLKSWHSIIGTTGVLGIFVFSAASVSVLVFRRMGITQLDQKIKGMGIIAPLAFMIGSLVIYWAKWSKLGSAVTLILVGLVLYGVSYFVNKQSKKEILGGAWMIGYLIVLMVLSKLGSFGGLNVIPAPWDSVVVAIVSLLCYFWAVNSGVKYMKVEEGTNHVRNTVHEIKKPFSLAEVLPYATTIEKYGIAGFGWGVSWVLGGHLQNFRSEGSMQEDLLAQVQLAGQKATACLFHLRRPSFLNTMAIRNTQPYLEPGAFGFAHNGFLQNSKAFVEELAQDLVGESDSEVGFLLYKRNLQTMSPTEALTQAVDDAIGTGGANIVVLNSNGDAVAIGRNLHAGHQNRLFRFTGNGFTGLVTELHSPDGTIFEKVLPFAQDIVQVTDAIEITESEHAVEA